MPNIQMKNLFLLILLSSTIASFAQATEKSTCVDTARYHINMVASAYPELEIKINGDWKIFPLIDERLERFDYECAEINFNGTGSMELLIRWSNAVYGSGGGSTIKRIQIWNLDNGTRILQEITSCSIENFGRGQDNPYYNVECRKDIEIQENTIIVHKKKCDSGGSATEDLPDPTLNCPLTTLEAETYLFENGQLIKK